MIPREKAIVNVQAFFPDDKEIVSILNACDLAPVENWKLWGNGKSPSIRMYSSRRMVCRMRDIKPPGTIDLYTRSHPKQIAELSKLALVIFVPHMMSLLLFLGKDDKLRLARYFEATGEWQRDYPLTMPLDDIRTLVKNKNIKEYRRVECTGSTKAVGWVTVWPPSKKLIQELDNEHEDICNSPARFLISDFSNT